MKTTGFVAVADTFAAAADITVVVVVGIFAAVVDTVAAVVVVYAVVFVVVLEHILVSSFLQVLAIVDMCAQYSQSTVAVK